MQYLAHDDARAWADAHGYTINGSFGRPVAADVRYPIHFQIPADAGARVALARVLWEASGSGVPEVLVWVTDWGVWPSGEYPPLAEAARRGLGADRPLAESPGHLVRLGEDDAGLSVLVLAVLFLWDCWVLPAGRRPAVFVSHDEYVVVDPRGDDHGVGARLQALGVVERSAPAI